MINRKKRTEILIRGRKELSKYMAHEARVKYGVKVINPANNGLVMIKCREIAKNSLFYLGEVLVTECTVEVNGELGLGIVAGNNEELSYNLAIIDAAYKANISEIEDWNKLLINEDKKIREAEELESKRILKTKVDFTTMNV